MKDLKGYEERINGHVFLTLDPEKEPDAYEREKNRFLELVWIYVGEYRSDCSELALEIIETINACLKSYNGDGNFTHYFNVSLKKAAAKSAAAEARMSRSGGMHVSEGLIDDAGAILRFSKRHGISLDEISEKRDRIAPALGITADRFDEIMKYLYYEEALSIDRTANGENAEDDEGWFDRISSAAGEQAGPEEEYIEKEKNKQILSTIEELYNSADERAKKVLSMKLTDMAVRADIGADGAEYSFIDKKLFELELKTGKNIKDKDIALACGCSPPNVTQIWRRFTAALKEKTE